MQQLLNVLAPTGYCYAEKPINFCLPIPLVSPFHRTNIYTKESFVLPTITTSIISWRINQLKMQTQKFCGLFCIDIAHFVFNARKRVNINDNELIRFAFHMMF